MQIGLFICLSAGFGVPYLKDLLTGHLDAAVPCLRLLLRQLLPEDFQLLHQVSFVFGHSETLCIIGQISRRQH